MAKYIIKRLLIAIPVLILITIIDFTLMSFSGQPLALIGGSHSSAAALAQRAANWGLDKPLIVQYFIWLFSLIQGNMGTSYSTFLPVSDMIASHLGPTLLLMGTALVVSLIFSLIGGIFSATHAYTKGDYTVVSLSFLSSSIPSFFLALLMIFIFVVKLKWLPSSGMVTLGVGGGALDIIRHMILPVLVLAFGMAGTNIRYFRSAVMEILQQDYLRTAKAKGIGRRKVIYKHALRNTMLTVITVIGMELPQLFGGAVVIEEVFSWPGLGLMTMSAITKRDYPVIMGTCLFAALVVLLGNIVCDILYALADPTISFQKGGGNG